MVIAIDGPAGAGKSSVARAVAAALGFTYLDPGRCIGAWRWPGSSAGADLDDAEAMAAIASALEIEFDGNRVRLGGRDVSSRDPRARSQRRRLARLGPRAGAGGDGRRASAA